MAEVKRDAETEKMLDEWVAARRARDFGKADQLRDELRRKGVDANRARPPPARKEARKPSGRASILYPPTVGTESGVKIVAVGGRCFRHPVREVRGYREAGFDVDAAGDVDIKFEQDTGHYVLELGKEAVLPECYKFVIGSKGATLQQLEQDTGCSIRVPKEGEGAGILLRALNETAVLDAKTRIEYLVERSREKLGYTHFLSIPLVDSVVPRCEELVSGLASLSSAESRVDPSLFQNPRKLHLTTLLLRLYSPEAVRRAVECLRKCEPILRRLFNSGDAVHLRGLNYMNDDPQNVDVLYVDVAANETRDKILQLVEEVAEVFIMADLASSREVEHTEKLHATIMNSKWRRGAEEQQGDDAVVLPPPRGAAAASSGGREGDWTCPNSNCGTNNFASRSKCHKCGRDRPGGGGGGGGGG
eukprot:Hpha_TRINITY_DN30527_c0_g1::TRINITY_DN30527_c0_g1_i1::g.193724::m.193724/K18666/ASCC1; activating signal cointegrator complex subunit 1